MNEKKENSRVSPPPFPLHVASVLVFLSARNMIYWFFFVCWRLVVFTSVFVMICFVFHCSQSSDHNKTMVFVLMSLNKRQRNIGWCGKLNSFPQFRLLIFYFRVCPSDSALVVTFREVLFSFSLWDSIIGPFFFGSFDWTHVFGFSFVRWIFWRDGLTNKSKKSC